MFKVCVDPPFMNCHRVYPLQQRALKKFIDACRESPGVKRIIVFGSSVTQYCTLYSDLDLYIVVDDGDQKHLPVVSVGKPMDVFWNDGTRLGKLEDEICRTGVIVYERDAT